MFNYFKNRRRTRLRAEPFPDAWRAALAANAPLIARLPDALREELSGLTQVFVGEKNFEGCGGLEMTDEVRVTIAAQACLLLAGRETDVFPKVDSVLVYPDTFVTNTVEHHDEFLVSEYEEEMEGEAWPTGAVVLAWRDVMVAAQRPSQGYNVVLHEFAHQIDLEHGEADGLPKLPPHIAADEWSGVMERAYAKHCADVDRRRRTPLDEYGAEDPAEFFAVASETFFETPVPLRQRHPELFELLKRFYGFDLVGR
jgi:hypothetical protein